MKLGVGISWLITIIGLMIFAIYKGVDNNHLKKTKKISVLYKAIITVNERYKFVTDIPKNIKFLPCMKSKRSLDNLNLTQYVANEIQTNTYYYDLFEKLENNNITYKKYLFDYKNIEKYMTEEEFNKLDYIKLKYKTFNKCEQRLYKSNIKKEPILSITANCHATYTSPSGRNYYWKDCNFSFEDLKSIVQQIKNHKQYLILEQERKVKALEEKRQKEKRLRELDKIERQLKEKEQLINEKETEFKKATKGHIYSAETSVKENDELSEGEETQYQKLKRLKKQFEKGEITREEYNKKRNELL